jgi:hypothetical protein
MKDNVFSIVGKQEAPKRVVEILELLLEQAHAGDVESFAVIVRRPNGGISTMVTATKDNHHLLAGTLYLQKLLLKDYDPES